MPSLRPLGSAAETDVRGDTIRIEAGAETDWFVDPRTETVRANAPALVGAVHGDFMLSAHVEVAFASTFDAGALVVWSGERTWAKLCLEYSPAGEAMIVSVVTRETSDDCNSVVVAGNGAWLRISRMGEAYAFHASTDGATWSLVRHFRLGAAEPEVGFEAQSPTGGGCAVVFSEIRFEAATLADLRSGA